MPGPDTSPMESLPEIVDGLPNLSGSERVVAEAISTGAQRPVFYQPSSDGQDPFDRIRSGAAIALHMHQPLIPVRGRHLDTASIMGNLQWMQEHQDIGDNHNAPVFRWCYQRMGEFVPQLLDEGHQPRVMLDYSGTLLYGLRQMGADDVLEGLRRITVEPRYQQAVEWLGCSWGHVVAPSTPVQDFRLHVRAWQHHFAGLFGTEALGRIRGFSPAEMALPNHPDVAYEFVRTLRDCGYQWVLVQEHTVETPDGHGPERPHLPHLLVCRNSSGESASIVAVVKTQGSDTKLVGQMQPYYEAKSLSRWELAGRQVPPLVTQVADGENGGVMMNEFPPKYFEVVRESSGTPTRLFNVTDYLERVWSLGVREHHLPTLQPLFQHRIWARCEPGDGVDRVADVIAQLQREDDRFHMDGGSWTNNISWVRGFEQVLAPMEQASSAFHEQMLAAGVPSTDPRYRQALFHLLTAETSCYRYWGQGVWTDYGTELARRVNGILASTR